MYGDKIAVSEFHPHRSVIGEILKSQSGNVILRIGREWTNDGATPGELRRGWEQTEHVVLKPAEISPLMHELADLSIRSTERIGLTFDRELATAIVRAFDGAPLDGKLDEFRNKLLDFVNNAPQ